MTEERLRNVRIGSLFYSSIIKTIYLAGHRYVNYIQVVGKGLLSKSPSSLLYSTGKYALNRTN